MKPNSEVQNAHASIKVADDSPIDITSDILMFDLFLIAFMIIAFIVGRENGKFECKK